MIHVLTEGSPNDLQITQIDGQAMFYPTFTYPKTILGEMEQQGGMTRRLTAITFLCKKTSDGFTYYERNLHTVELNRIENPPEIYAEQKLEFLKRFSADLRINQIMHIPPSLSNLVANNGLFDDINNRIYEHLERYDSPHKNSIAHRHNLVTESPTHHGAVVTHARRRGRSHVNDAVMQSRIERERQVERIREEQAAERSELVSNDRYIIGMDPYGESTNPVDNDELAQEARRLFGENYLETE